MAELTFVSVPRSLQRTTMKAVKAISADALGFGM